MQKAVLVGIASFFVTLSVQAEYIVELDAGYFETDQVFGTTDGYSVDGTVFFSHVDTSKGPLAEASFLDRASGVSATFEDVEGVDTKGIGGRFVFGNGLIFKAAYSEVEDVKVLGASTFSGVFSGSRSESSTSIDIGKYLTNASELVVFYVKEEVDIDIEFGDIGVGMGFGVIDPTESGLLVIPEMTAPNNIDLDTAITGINYHGVASTAGNASFSYDAGMVYIDVPGDSGIGINGLFTYYPSPLIGIGGSLSISSVGDIDTVTYGAGVDYFFGERVAGSFSFARSETSNDGFLDNSFDRDTLSIGVTLRF